MMKLLTGDWIAAERENQVQRDARRKQFWSETGIQPAKNTSDIDIPPETRLSTLNNLVEVTLAGKEPDENLKAITLLAGVQAANIAVGSFSHSVASFAPDMMKMAPKALRAFFLIPERTSYERSKEEGET